MATERISELVEDLTPRERQVLELLRAGLTNRQIAQRLQISPDGAKYHVSEIIGKLGVRNRYEASVWPERPPWWMAGGLAPIGFWLKRAGASWLSKTAAGVAAVAVAAGIGLLVWSLLRTNGGGDAVTVPEGFQRLEFAPGETITATGPGIFFVDPETGAAEAWVMPDVGDFDALVGAVSADGRLVLFGCRQQDQSELDPPACASERTFLLNTQTGNLHDLPDDIAYRTLSPDGETLLAETADGLGLAAVDSPEQVRMVEPAVAGEGLRGPASQTWSPDSQHIVLSTADGTHVVDVATSTATRVHDRAVEGVGWSPDGSKVALVQRSDEKAAVEAGTFVFDVDGNELWRAAVGGLTPNPQWSPDGERLVVQVDAPPDPSATGRYFRLDAFDGDAGDPLYRVMGAIACAGPVWTADGERLVIETYDYRYSMIADPKEESFLALPSFVTPSPINLDAGIELAHENDEANFYSVEFLTGERTLLSRTTVDPAWHGGHHEPLFVGERLVFAAPHGGHGGCAEGGFPEDPPPLEFKYPPFD